MPQIKTSEYMAWQSMKARCSNPNNAYFHRYGGRGISVCERWRGSYKNFLADVGEKPCKSLTLDRINSDGDYEPGNVRWADRYTQNRNFSDKNSPLGIRGVRILDGRYYAYIHKDRKSIQLGGYDNFFDACCARKSAEITIWGEGE